MTKLRVWTGYVWLDHKRCCASPSRTEILETLKAWSSRAVVNNGRIWREGRAGNCSLLKAKHAAPNWKVPRKAKTRKVKRTTTRAAVPTGEVVPLFGHQRAHAAEVDAFVFPFVFPFSSSFRPKRGSVSWWQGWKRGHMKFRN